MAVRKHPKILEFYKYFYLNSKFNFEEKPTKLILRCELVHCVMLTRYRDNLNLLQLANIEMKNISR